MLGARAPTSRLQLVTCFLVQLTSRPPGFARSVLNAVITNAQATVKNYMSVNYDWLRFSGSAQRMKLLLSYKLGFHGGTVTMLFRRWMDSRRVPADLKVPSN